MFDHHTHEHPQRLQRWLEGQPASSTDTQLVDIVVAGRETPNQPIAGQGIIFVPEGFKPDSAFVGQRQVVEYWGELATTDAEIGLGRHVAVAIESYSTIGYMQLASAAAISITDQADVHALHQDAEIAMAEGRFPTHLLNSHITLIDLQAWLRRNHRDQVQRILVRPDGSMTAGLTGEDISPESLQWPDECRILPPDIDQMPDEELRPVQRYLGAIRAIQLMSIHQTSTWWVSGFAWQAFGLDDNNLGPSDPYLLRDAANTYWLVDPGSTRGGKVSAAVAEAVYAYAIGVTPSTSCLETLGLARLTDADAVTLYTRLGLRVPQSTTI